jgi:hypothetical protein
MADHYCNGWLGEEAEGLLQWFKAWVICFTESMLIWQIAITRKNVKGWLLRTVKAPQAVG